MSETRELLEGLARKYKILDIREKRIKAKKDEVRSLMMVAMTQASEEESAADITGVDIAVAEVDARFDGDVHKAAAYFYPGWIIQSYTRDDTNYLLTLTEDIALRKYEFESGDFKFGRTVRYEGAQFDSEGFVAEVASNPDWDVVPGLHEVLSARETVEWDFDENKALELMTEYPETVPLFQRFSFQGKPKVVMLPISKKREDTDPD